MNRKKRCTFCDEPGHNKQTCSELAKLKTSDFQRWKLYATVSMRQKEEDKRAGRSKQKVQRIKKQVNCKCGYCGHFGHSIRTCSDYKEDNKNRRESLKLFQKNMKHFLKKIGLGLGSIVRFHHSAYKFGCKRSEEELLSGRPNNNVFVYGIVSDIQVGPRARNFDHSLGEYRNMLPLAPHNVFGDKNTYWTYVEKQRSYGRSYIDIKANLKNSVLFRLNVIVLSAGYDMKKYGNMENFPVKAGEKIAVNIQSNSLYEKAISEFNLDQYIDQFPNEVLPILENVDSVDEFFDNVENSKAFKTQMCFYNMLRYYYSFDGSTKRDIRSAYIKLSDEEKESFCEVASTFRIVTPTEVNEDTFENISFFDIDYDNLSDKEIARIAHCEKDYQKRGAHMWLTYNKRQDAIDYIKNNPLKKDK